MKEGAGAGVLLARGTPLLQMSGAGAQFASREILFLSFCKFLVFNFHSPPWGVEIAEICELCNKFL